MSKKQMKAKLSELIKNYHYLKIQLGITQEEILALTIEINGLDQKEKRNVN